MKMSLKLNEGRVTTCVLTNKSVKDGHMNTPPLLIGQTVVGGFSSLLFSRLACYVKDSSRRVTTSRSSTADESERKRNQKKVKYYHELVNSRPNNTNKTVTP